MTNQLTYFPVTGHFYDVEAPDRAGNTNVDQFKAMSGYVTFTPRVPAGFTALVNDLELEDGEVADTAVAIAPIVARIVDGTLCAIDSVNTEGISLLANSPALALTSQGITNLVYDVQFDQVTYAGKTQVLQNFAFIAPVDASPIDITDSTLVRLQYLKTKPLQATYAPPQAVVSAFGQTLIQQSSATAALGALGVSDQGKRLVESSDQATIRNVLNTQAQRVQLANNCIGRCRDTTVTAVGTYRFPHKIGVAGTDLQFGFGLWYTNYPTAPIVDVDVAASVTFSVGFEDAAGHVYQALFSGAKLYTLSGGGFVLTDPLPIDVAVGDIVYVRVFISSGTAHANRGTGLNSIGGFTATTDLTLSGSGAVDPTFTANGWGPMCIIGTPTNGGIPNAVVLQGDSIGAGIGDGAFTGFDFGYLPQVPANLYYCGGGFLQRALSGYAGTILEAQQGDTANAFKAGVGHFRRAGLTRFTKYAVIEYGRNDLTGLQTPTQVQTSLLTVARQNLAKGLVGSILTTITPYSSSTDNFATVGNQTPVSSTNEANRVTHNTWVRAGCPIIDGVPVAVGTDGALTAGQSGHPILGYVDAAAGVESSLNSGKWKAANRVVSDAAIGNGSGTLTSATAAFTNADLGREVNIAGAGIGGTVLGGVIMTINSTTEVVITAQSNADITDAQCVIGPYTTDGLHPNTTGHAAMTTAVQSSLLALLA